MTIIRKRCIGSVHPAFIQPQAKAALQNIFWRRAPMFHASWVGYLRRLEHRKAAKIRKALRALSDALWDVVESGASQTQVAYYLINGGHYPHELREIFPTHEQLDDEACRASECAYERSIGA